MHFTNKLGILIQNLIYVEQNTPNNILVKNMKLKKCMMSFKKVKNFKMLNVNNKKIFPKKL